jgi:protein-L-isoaspartate(D-aspartate) O-methyltransferase
MTVRSAKTLLFLLFLDASCGPAEISRREFAVERERMVKEQVAMRGVTNERVLTAVRKVPRDQFVPEVVRNLAYTDQPLPIGHDQTISQPFIVAFMTEKLKLQPTDRVLEIGTGSGYQAAILAELAAQVYTIEIVAPLGERAKATLQRLDYKNVHVKVGDGYQGWPEEAPFDAVIVTCAPEHVPRPLIDQTREGGRVIIPVGAAGNQQLYLLEKREGRLRQRAVLPVRFVPMTGRAREEKTEEAGRLVAPPR